MALKLNLGAGDVPVEGFEPVDIKQGKNAFPLMVEPGTVDEIRASHILEHFGTRELLAVLDDWFKALKPGGKLSLAVPNAEKAGGALIQKRGTYDGETSLLLAYLMGGQVDEHDVHRSAFTPASLKALMEAAGLRQITPWKSDVNDCAALPVSLNLCGYKPGGAVPKCQAVMSVPRLGFLDNIFCAASAFMRYGIELTKFTGVFWGQCMTRGMNEALSNDVKYIITIDYDTLFDAQDVGRLIRLMETTDADAICGTQMKREVDAPLFTMTDSDGELLESFPGDTFDGELTRVNSGHFGLTIIRAESLRKLPKPWFKSEPNDNGEWEDGRTDEDMWFWARWKDAGLSLYQSNYCTLGHLQLMATWPDSQFRPMYQYITDYYKAGKPLGVK